MSGIECEYLAAFLSCVFTRKEEDMLQGQNHVS
jgi:hypothetical protein